jgi:hypothetical protein
LNLGTPADNSVMMVELLTVYHLAQLAFDSGNAFVGLGTAESRVEGANIVVAP